VPPPAERASASNGHGGPSWIKDQYRAALDQARREGKLVFINFTGVACANCHWMEANMLPRPESPLRSNDSCWWNSHGPRRRS